ncbi:MAG TPA: hypothetical protein VGS58_12645, partial [Candidatus Sulfopaludibacter sp.]|nr:hypothetical protein [Candidatus Sulfopaludibacter sp.]
RSPGYARRNCNPILFPGACLCSAAGAARRSASWCMTGKGLAGAKAVIARAIPVVAERKGTGPAVGSAPGTVAAGGRQSGYRGGAGMAQGELKQKAETKVPQALEYVWLDYRPQR